MIDSWANYRGCRWPAGGHKGPAGKARSPGLPVTALCDPPLAHSAVAGPAEWDAITHLVDTQDIQAATLAARVQQMAAVADPVSGPSWAHPDPDYNVRQWSGLLDMLHPDAHNKKFLDQLAHMGAAGQAEANRLIYSWVKPAGVN